MGPDACYHRPTDASRGGATIVSALPRAVNARGDAAAGSLRGNRCRGQAENQDVAAALAIGGTGIGGRR